MTPRLKLLVIGLSAASTWALLAGLYLAITPCVLIAVHVLPALGDLVRGGR